MPDSLDSHLPPREYRSDCASISLYSIHGDRQIDKLFFSIGCDEKSCTIPSTPAPAPPRERGKSLRVRLALRASRTRNQITPSPPNEDRLTARPRRARIALPLIQPREAEKECKNVFDDQARCATRRINITRSPPRHSGVGGVFCCPSQGRCNRAHATVRVWRRPGTLWMPPPKSPLFVRRRPGMWPSADKKTGSWRAAGPPNLPPGRRPRKH